MLESLNDWTINIRNGNYTRVVFIDFAKAFDSVCHNKLLHKLSCLGVSGPLLKIIASFLNCRSQGVVVNGILLKSLSVTSGVPLGTVLGPILFIIYVNDLSSVFPKTIV